jgi:hypothetical protein
MIKIGTNSSFLTSSDDIGLLPVHELSRNLDAYNVKCQSSNLKLSAQRATLPGIEISFTLCPLTPAWKAGYVRALAGQIKSKAKMPKLLNFEL